MDMAVEDLFLNSKLIMEDGQCLVSYVYQIPDTVSDENLVKFYQHTKSRAAEYLVIATLNMADRTITFLILDDTWSPGPALNKHGKLELDSFTVSFPEKRCAML